MNDLKIITNDGVLVADSRDVAELTDKRHSDLLRDISNYSTIISESTNANLRSLDFFIPSTYQDAKNEERPCYLITRKGCDMVANKMTGEKGVLFTAAYVTKFEDMEHALQHPKLMSELEVLHRMSGALLEQSRQVQQLSGSVETLKTDMQEMREVIELDQTGWREDCTKLVKRIAKKAGGYDKIRAVWTEVHRNVDSRLGANLQRRLDNKRQRMAVEGISKTAREAVSILDIIAEDKKLIDGTVHIVKMLAVKNGVRWTEEEMP